MSVTLVYTLLTAPLPQVVHTGQCPSPARRSARSYLVRYIQAQTFNNGGEWITTAELENATPLPPQREEIRRLTKETVYKELD